MCSEIAFQTLDDVLVPGTRVVRVKILSVTPDSDEDNVRFRYRFELLETMLGEKAAITSGLYEYPIPVFKDEKGEVVGHYSPVLPASGYEERAKAGEICFVLTQFEPEKGGVRVLRMEPSSNEKDVRARVKQLAPK